MADFSKVTLATVGWEIVNHCLYSCDLAPGEFNLFGLMKVHLEERNFKLMLNSDTVS
jgi:hypothetical protein